MKGVLTVVGKDKVGIIADVCVTLRDQGVNILDISQSITGGYFHMMMVVDMGDNNDLFRPLSVKLNELGEELGVQIKLQSEEIFNAMQRI